MSISNARSVVLSLLALGALAACRDQGGGNRAQGTQEVDTDACETSADCDGQGLCISNVCTPVTTCTADDQCIAEGKVCHSIRAYCVECDGRHPGECPAGETCQPDFTCTGPIRAMQTCEGTCVDDTGCGDGQTCEGGVCCTGAVARCFTAADCPVDRPECNTATGQCHAGAECANDADCATGKFCVLDTTPSRCANAPTCTSDAACVPFGLICNARTGRCENGDPCPNGNECNAPGEVCNRRTHTCQLQTCVNDPTLCTTGYACDMLTGQCTPVQGGACTTDATCPADRYCDTTTMTCRVGCRSSADCNGGVCTAQHQCQSMGGGTSGVCGPCTVDADCPAGTQCLEGLGCFEPCNEMTMTGCTIDPTSICLLGNCICLF